MTIPEPSLHLTRRDEWRAWLEVNHARATEVWLILDKKHTGRPSLSLAEAVEEALCFGWIDGLLHRIDDEQYTLRFSPRKKDSVWSQVNKRRVAQLIRQGRMTEAGLAKIKEARANGQWRAATMREDTANLPLDLKRALKANRQAQEHFDQLAPSRKRQFLYWIATAKTDATRKRRIQEAVKMIAANKRLGTA